MNVRCFRFVLVIGAALLFGCNRPDTDHPLSGKLAATNASVAVPPSALPAVTHRSDNGVTNHVATLARIHWLGKRQLAAETNATAFMRIWEAPESARLENQTLDKLASAPWRLGFPSIATNPQPTALLRPLLDDLVKEEVYLEIRGASNQPGEAVFAIRLDEMRAALWKTNLAAFLELLTGSFTTNGLATNRIWMFAKQDAPDLIELAQAGGWTIICLAPRHNSLMESVLARLERDHVPFIAGPTNYWIEADMNLPAIASTFSRKLNIPTNFPSIHVVAIGDGESVRTRGDLLFPAPLNLELDPWMVPTNMIREPLASFTAVRGIKTIFDATGLLSKVGMTRNPGQLIGWSQEGVPQQTFFAAPLPDASNQVSQITEFLLKEGNSWLVAEGAGIFERSPKGIGVKWTGIPFITPFVQFSTDDNTDYIYGGYFPSGRTNRPPIPNELLLQVFRSTNTVCYDWEITGSRIEGWICIGQTLRLATSRAQVPPRSASIAWLNTAISKLGNCATEVTWTDTNRLSFVRRSSVGFTSIELHLLVDWLESSDFPQGLNTLSHKRTASLKSASPVGTNSSILKPN